MQSAAGHWPQVAFLVLILVFPLGCRKGILNILEVETPSLIIGLAKDSLFSCHLGKRRTIWERNVCQKSVSEMLGSFLGSTWTPTWNSELMVSFKGVIGKLRGMWRRALQGMPEQRHPFCGFAAAYILMQTNEFSSLQPDLLLIVKWSHFKANHKRFGWAPGMQCVWHLQIFMQSAKFFKTVNNPVQRNLEKVWP